MWDIYCITNKINNKSYVGLSSNVDERWKNHIRDSVSKLKSRYHAFQSAINKYGKDSFTWQVIETHDSLESANDAEEFFIAYFNTLVPNGYNLTSGGDSQKLHESTKKKISDTLKKTSSLIGSGGPKHYRFGKPCPQYIKDSLIKHLSGENGPRAKLKKEDVINIYNMGLEGKNSSEIRIDFPLIKQGAILNILHKKSWKTELKSLPDIDFSKIKRKDPPRKEQINLNKRHKTKFTKEQIAEICLCEDSSAILAEKYNVDSATIRNMRKRLLSKKEIECYNNKLKQKSINIKKYIRLLNQI